MCEQICIAQLDTFIMGVIIIVVMMVISKVSDAVCRQDSGRLLCCIGSETSCRTINKFRI